MRLNASLFHLTLTIFIIIEVSFSKYLNFSLRTKKQELQLLEQLYLSSVPSVDNTNDPVCTLSKHKKIALCEFIFNQHKKLGVQLNKAATYLHKLSCEKMELTIEHHTIQARKNIKKSIKQIMYSCPGRQAIVRTSLIEDDNYDAFYVSSGPVKNSVIVYLRNYNELDEKINLYDYIDNIEFSKLRDMNITVKEVTTELKLNKEMYSTNDIEETETIYLREQKNLHNDPVCDLEYEKKMSLCRIVLDTMGTALNKGATYLFSMDCITASIRKFSDLFKTILLAEKQTIYPCFGRHPTSINSFLTDDYTKKVYLSSGPKRNSVLVYIRIQISTSEDVFTTVKMIENIDIKNLKPYTITLNDIKAESEVTYVDVIKTTTLIKFQYGKEINAIKELNLSNELENMMIKALVGIYESDLQKIKEITEAKIEQKNNLMEAEKSNNQSETSQDTKKNQSDQKQYVSNVMTKRHQLQVGFQMFKRLVEQKRNKLLQPDSPAGSNLATERIKKKFEEMKLKKKADLIKTKYDQVQKFIREMELFVSKTTETLGKMKETQYDDEKPVQKSHTQENTKETKKKKKK